VKLLAIGWFMIVARLHEQGMVMMMVMMVTIEKGDLYIVDFPIEHGDKNSGIIVDLP
jgi:hypothetical protein